MTIFESLETILYEYIIPNGYAINELAVDLVCLIASLAVVALPFVVVWRIIKLFIRG